MLFRREGWDAFTSAHPYLQVLHPKFEIHKKTIGVSALTDVYTPRKLLPLHHRRYSIKYK